VKRAVFKNVTGKRIQRCRKSRIPPLTQKDLAGCLTKHGVPMTQHALSRIESRQLGVSDIELIAFAKCLGVSVGFLCGK
jgi:hypothetical protein